MVFVLTEYETFPGAAGLVMAFSVHAEAVCVSVAAKRT